MGLNPRALGVNPRALGVNPCALGVNPRALGTNPRALASLGRWFRFYEGAVDDPKVQRLPPTLFKAWVNMLCIASRCGGILPTNEDLQFALRMTARQVDNVLKQLHAAGLLDAGDDEVLRPHNWDGRQFKSDSNDPTGAERQRKYRAHKRDIVTLDTVTTTPTRAESEQSTESESESESEKKKKDIPVAAPRKPVQTSFLNGHATDFQAFYDAYGFKKDRRGAERAYLAAVKRGASPEQLLDAAKRYALSRKPEFVKYPETWLNKDAWLDEGATKAKGAADPEFLKIKAESERVNKMRLGQ